MTVQSTVGGVLGASVLGLEIARPDAGPGAVSAGRGAVSAGRGVSALAFTGAGFTTTLIILAAVLIVAGMLLHGLSRRHGARQGRRRLGGPSPSGA